MTSTYSKPLPTIILTFVVCVILFLTILVPIINDSTEPVDKGNGYSFDDLKIGQYYHVDDLKEASGSVEIVEYGGKNYLYAKNIGEGQIKIKGGYKDVYVNKSTLNVFLLTGQSQSVYRDYNVSVANNELDHYRCGQAFYFGTESTPMVYSSTWANNNWNNYDLFPMTNIDGSFRVGSLEAPLSSTFVNRSGESILIINTGINGRTITSFYDDQDAELYGNTVITKALESIDTSKYDVKILGWFWLHGQANANDDPIEYLDKFSKVREIYAEYGFHNCMIELPRGIEAPKIVRADYLIADTFDDCYIASVLGQKFSTVGPYIDDGTHYNQYGRDIVGIELMDYYLNNVNPEIAYSYPQLGSVNSIVSIIPVVVVISLICGMVAYTINRRVSRN